MQNSENIKEITRSELLRLSLNTKTIFAKEPYASEEVRRGNARMVGRFSDKREEVFVLERV